MSTSWNPHGILFAAPSNGSMHQFTPRMSSTMRSASSDYTRSTALWELNDPNLGLRGFARAVRASGVPRQALYIAGSVLSDDAESELL